MQALDPRLDLADPGLGQQPHLIARQVRLGLVKQRGSEARLAERRQERAEVGHVQDVVREADAAVGIEHGLVARHQVDDLALRAPGRLAPVAHRQTVEPAERAVVLLPPPATPRGLERDVAAHSRPER